MKFRKPGMAQKCPWTDARLQGPELPEAPAKSPMPCWKQTESSLISAEAGSLVEYSNCTCGDQDRQRQTVCGSRICSWARAVPGCPDNRSALVRVVAGSNTMDSPPALDLRRWRPGTEQQ